MSPPSFREAVRFWIKLGFISLGGPAGQIAVMHRELVDRKGWISESRFLHALNFCMHLAAYCGWLMHGVRGALAAGILFIVPGIFILRGLSWIYMAYGEVAAVVGVILNLAVWFGLHVIAPSAGAVHWFAVVVGFGAFAAMQWRKIDMVPVIVTCGAAGFPWEKVLG